MPTVLFGVLKHVVLILGVAPISLLFRMPPSAIIRLDLAPDRMALVLFLAFTRAM